MKKKSTVYLAQAGVIAAMYTALTYIFQPFSFSGGQIRIAEALTLLPVLTPAAVPGLTLGCFLSNLSSPYGFIDIILGTAATLVSALLTRCTGKIRFKNIPFLSAVFPVIFNALSAGACISIYASGGFTLPLFIFNALSVIPGEAFMCFVPALLLNGALEKTKLFKDTGNL